MRRALVQVLEIRFERQRMAMRRILRAVNQCNRAAAQTLDELSDCCRILIQFLKITIPKLVPFQRIVAEPRAQRCAGRYILKPPIDARRILGNAARPQPVHQNPQSVIRSGRLIRAFQQNRHGLLSPRKSSRQFAGKSNSPRKRTNPWILHDARRSPCRRLFYPDTSAW